MRRFRHSLPCETVCAEVGQGLRSEVVTYSPPTPDERFPHPLRDSLQSVGRTLPPYASRPLCHGQTLHACVLAAFLSVWRFELRHKPAQGRFIFGGNPSTNGTSYAKSLRPLLRSLGLPVGTGWHCFRRLHASLLQQAGASSIETSKLVGHVAVSTTADYTIVGQAREAELVNSVCERLLLAPVK
jgi:hypothetical protein